MYQPRRANQAPLASLGTTDAVAPQSPRRAAARPSARSVVGPAAVSGSLILSVSALTLNVAAADVNSVAAQPTAELTAAQLAATHVASATASYPEEELRLMATIDVLPGHQSSDDAEPAKGKAAGKRYATTALTLRTLPDSDTAKLGSLKKGASIKVTDKVVDGFRQVSYKGDLAYVTNKYLTKVDPAVAAAAAKAAKEAQAAKASSSSSSSTKSSSTKSSSSSTSAYTGSTTYTGKTVLGLKPRAMVVYNAVTARWSFSSIGGYRPNSLSNHQFGGAIDFMLTPGKDSAKGWAVAKWLAANASKFNIDHIIFEQRIWTPYRQTWRMMENRGSSTANHMDHVHVSVKL